MAKWFTEAEGKTGLPVCRVKNGFASTAELQGDAPTYSDLKLFVLFEGTGGLRIIGEIQVLNYPINHSDYI